MVTAWIVGQTVLVLEPDSGRKKRPAQMLLSPVRLQSYIEAALQSRQGIKVQHRCV